MDGLRGRGSSGVWHHGGLEDHRAVCERGCRIIGRVGDISENQQRKRESAQGFPKRPENPETRCCRYYAFGCKCEVVAIRGLSDSLRLAIYQTLFTLTSAFLRVAFFLMLLLEL